MKKTRLFLSIILILCCILLCACKEEPAQVTPEEVSITLDAKGGEVEATSLSVTKGEAATLPTPAKQDRTFLGWFDEEGNSVTNTTPINNDITLFAKWDKYKVVFLNEEKVYKVLEENVDEAIIYPSTNPTKSPDQDYCYTFTGWDVSDDKIITEDLTVNALYSQEAIKWAMPLQSLNSFNSMFKLSYIYKESLFDQPTTTFNKDLALFAFGAANSTESASVISSFYSNLEFDDIYVSPSYSKTPTVDSVAYIFAHKLIKGSDVICITVRGSNYQKEWANNFIIGKTGNHEGFYNAATSIYNDLETYLEKYSSSTSLKVLVDGYSRGGGIANALAHKILNTSTILNTDNLYVYTFEAPAAVEAKGNIKYSNVFNIVNSADVVTLIPPLKYGLARCGIDIEIYNSNIDTIMTSYSAFYKLPSFEASSNYASDIAFTNYVINTLTSYTGSNPSLNNREAYYNNYQSAISYAVELAMSINKSTITQIQNDLSSRNKMELVGLLSGDGLYTYLNSFLKQDGISYSEAELKDACSVLSKLIGGPAMSLITALASSPNLTRILNMHQFEVTYALLVAYEK